MIRIYHNPRCSKSRQGLQLLQDSGKEFEIINYMTDNPTVSELQEIIQTLGIKPIELIRKNEQLWKDEYRDNQLTDEQIIAIMAEHPRLIERPIVISGNKAVIGRPPENISSLL